MFRPKTTSILLLPGFDEGWVIQSIDRLVAQGYPCNTLSIKAHSVRGIRGLQIEPDKALNSSSDVRNLLIPDCKESLPTLMTEPRIHRLIRSVLAEDGAVIVSPSVAAAFARVGLEAGAGRNYHVISSPERLSALAN